MTGSDWWTRLCSGLRLLTLIVFLAAAALPTLAAAQPQEIPPALSWVEPEIQRCEQQVNRIRWHAHMTLALALTVGVLGIAISALQAWSAPGAKTVVIGMGLAISSLTLIADQIYHGVTHHTLYARCSDGEKLVNSMRLELRRARGMAEADGGLQGLRQVLEERLTKCDALNANGGSGDVRASLPRLGSPAFAGVSDGIGDGPSWLSGRSPTETAIYFVGVAHGRDATVGREESLRNARNAIQNYLESKLAEPGAPETGLSPAIARQLASGAGVVDTYAAFDRASGFVSSYALLALDRRQLRRSLLAAAATSDGGGVVKVDQLDQINGPSTEYEASRQRAYACILDKSRQTMSKDAYEQFVAAREGRKQADQTTRDYNAALSAMRTVTEQHPDCYLCWYNLALLLQRTHEPQAAIAAFEKAIVLEPALGCGDASIYATFGRLLVDEKQYAEALPVLETAARYESQHPYVGQLIARAKEGLNAAP